MICALSFAVVRGTSPAARGSDWIVIYFAEDCAANGFPLGVSTVTSSPPSETASPSTNGPGPGGMTEGPPTGLPSTFFPESASNTSPGSGSVIATSPKETATSQPGPPSSTTGPTGGSSGDAKRVGNGPRLYVWYLWLVWL